MKKLIRDRRGRVLEFSQERLDGLVYFKLEFKTVCAAYVNCQIDGEVLMLVDIFVEDNCVVRQPDWLKRLFGHKTLAVNFRNQGIGGQLLATVTAYAKSKGLKRIEVSLAEKGLPPDSQLTRWYQKRGFTVREAGVFKDLGSLPKDDSRYMPKV